MSFDMFRGNITKKKNTNEKQIFSDRYLELGSSFVNNFKCHRGYHFNAKFYLRSAKSGWLDVNLIYGYNQIIGHRLMS